MNQLPAKTARPKWHFTPECNWLNDPNGLFHLDGTWHLFFQHNPLAPTWGNMSWGHAISTNLLTWTELDVAIRFREDEGIFSGSVVVDHGNTSGLGNTSEPPVVALFTSAYSSGLQAQSLAVSNDLGATFTRVGDGPVLDRRSSHFRDPKVVRYVDDAGLSHWIMITVEALDRQVLIHSSNDLMNWTQESTFGPLGPEGAEWECPDLFELELDGDPSRRRWVMLLSFNPVPEDPHGSSMVYFIGDFDGHTFIPDDTSRWDRVDHGRDFYAGVTFDNAPGNSRIMIGWMNNWRYGRQTPTEPWRGAMSLPRQLTLGTIDGKPHLLQRPLLPDDPERVHAVDWDATVPHSMDLLVGERGPAAVLSWEPHTRMLVLDRSVGAGAGFHPDFPSVTRVAMPDRYDRIHLTVVTDGHLIEVFSDDGAITISEQAFS